MPTDSAPGLLDPRTIRAIATQLDLRPTKQRGQNFVHDANTVRRIVALAQLPPGEHVLEVGPGLGSLTLGLLEAGHRVSAIEIDERLAGRLPATVSERLPGAEAALRVITADALRVDRLPGDPVTQLVANLPYNVSVPVLLELFANFDTLRGALVMVQAEVAARLVAPPGSRTYGVPSAKIAWYAHATQVGSVSPKVFWPEPNVDSGLVSLVRRAPPATVASRELVFSVIDHAFAQRRKMLRSALAGLFGSSAAAAAALAAAGVDPQVRGEVLDISAFSRIAERLC